jgi:hypothetical protein
MRACKTTPAPQGKGLRLWLDMDQQEIDSAYD